MLKAKLKRWGIIALLLAGTVAGGRWYARRVISQMLTPHIIGLVRHGDIDSVLFLVDSGAEMDARDEQGCTALFHAASLGDVQILKTLLRGRTDVNARNNLGQTPLHWAARADHVECVRELINSGAKVNMRDSSGDTPLFWAESVRVVSLLIGAGADVNIRNEKGETPLFSMAFPGHTDCIVSLARHGADINSRDRNGETPLFAAIIVQLENPSGVKALIEHGADVNARNKDGLSVLDCCLYHRGDAYEFLIRHGAKTSSELDAKNSRPSPERIQKEALRGRE